MLATGVISIGIKFRIAIPIQRLCTSIKTYSTSSSSSDSSDSDSDNENIRKIKKNEQLNRTQNESMKTTRTLNTLIDNIMEKSGETKGANVAIPLRKTTKNKKFVIREPLSYAAQLIKAAEDVANVLEGDKKQIKFKLLDRLTNAQAASTNKGTKPRVKYLNQLLTNMDNKYDLSKDKKSKQSTAPTYSIGQQLIAEERKQSTAPTYSIGQQLIAEERKQSTAPTYSIGQQLIIEERNKKLQSNEQLATTATTTKVNNVENRFEDRKKQEQKNLRNKQQDLEYYVTNSTIFKDMKKNTTNVPELSTWKSLQQRELNLLSNQAPKNIFQEMIQWTESGKLWKFPIDNEYGMEEESNIHFTEHVFLERHLKDWCPRRGPIRHYMELVCTGLSKNPYMTVDEKIGHIMWYKEYFSGKKELLVELGAIDVTSNNEEEIKA